MGKIGDIWVALGLDSKALRDGLKQAKKAVSDYAKSAGDSASMMGKAMVGAAAAAGAAIGAAFVKLTHDLIKNTQSIGDAWGRQMSGMKTAWQTFVSSVANTDFKDIGKKLREAFQGGKEYYNQKDAETEMKNSIDIQKSMMAKEQEILQQRMRNVNLSYEERKKAAEQYLANEKKIFDQEAALAKHSYNAEIDRFLLGSGLQNSPQIQRALEQWLIRGKTGLDDNLYGLDRIFAQQYQKSDADISMLVSAMQGAYESDAAFMESTQRVNTMLNGFIAKGASGDVSEASKAMREFMERALEGGLVDTDFDAETQAWMKLIGDPKPAAEQWLEEFQDEWDKEMAEWRDSIQMDDISAVPLPFDLAAVERMKDAVDELAASLKDGLVNALDELAYALGGVEDANFGTVLTAFLAPLADAAVQAGMIIMTTGEGLEALKKALANAFGTGPGVAIAAGAALIGVGVAAKAGLAAIANRQGGVSGTAAYAGSGDPAAYESGMEITVKVEGRLKGQDILLSGENTMASLAR